MVTPVFCPLPWYQSLCSLMRNITKHGEWPWPLKSQWQVIENEHGNKSLVFIKSDQCAWKRAAHPHVMYCKIKDKQVNHLNLFIIPCSKSIPYCILLQIYFYLWMHLFYESLSAAIDTDDKWILIHARESKYIHKKLICFLLHFVHLTTLL